MPGVRQGVRGVRAPSRAAPPPPRPLSLDDDDFDRPAPPRRVPPLAIVGVGVLALCGLGVVGYFLLSSDPPAVVEARPAASDAPAVLPVRTPPADGHLEALLPRLKASTVYIRVTSATGAVSSGTGFFAGGPGYVVTNAHVIGLGKEPRPPRRVEVIVGGGERNERTLTAQMHGGDVENDLALLRVAGDDLPPPLDFGEAAKLVETQEVVIFGYPFGEMLGKNISVNRSTVSSLRKERGALVVVQLAGGLNPGNSGGPVTNTRGEVIGVSVAKLRGTDTIAFAIPAEVASAFVQTQLRTGGRLNGVAFTPKTPTAAAPAPPPPAVSPPIPPVNPVAITPAPVTAEGLEVKLPAEAAETCVGGGGRFLIVSLPRLKQIAVLDTSAARVVRYLTVPSDKVLVAAGMDKLMVADPETGVVQRWSLTTFEKEVTAVLPLTAGLKVTTITMGSASNGPLLVEGLDYPRLGEWFALDIFTLKERAGPPRHNITGSAPGDRVRASADGRTFVVHRPHGNASILTLPADGPKWAVTNTPWSGRPGSMPSADGNTVYGLGEMCAANGTRIGAAAGGSRYYIPAVHGPLVLAVNDLNDRSQTARGFRPAVHAPRDTRPMFNLPAFPALGTLFVPNEGWRFDGRVFFVPKAQAVAVVPLAGDKVVLYKVDIDAELAKADIDYLFVSSQPPAAVPGKRFEYAIEARAKKGGLTYKLDFGPEGMTIAADGKVTWAVPPDFAKPVNAAVTVGDASGQEVIHTFELVPAAN